MKHILRTRKALAQLKEERQYGTNSFGLVFRDRPPVLHRGKVCYNILNVEHPSYSGETGPISFISLISPLNPGELLGITAVQFMNWLMRDSPFSHVFYTKSGKRALKEGMVCHTDVPAPMLIGGLSIAREVNECPDKVVLWGELVRLGMKPIHAYVATYYLIRLSGMAFQVKKPPYNTNHLALSYPLTREYIKNFCLGRVVSSGMTNFRECTRFYGVFLLWGKQGAHDRAIFRYSKPPTKIEHSGWGNNSYTSSIITYKTTEERQEFVREFTKQIEEICNG